jgi:hypothetical protein
MLVLSKKCTTQIGSPIPYLYLKRIKIGGCVFIILISTRHVKRSVRPTLNRSSCGLQGKLQPFEFSILLVGLSSDSLERRRSNQDILPHSIRCFLLHNIVRTQKCRCNISKAYTMVSTLSTWTQCWSVSWWCGCQDSGRLGTHLWPGRNLWQPEKIQNEAKP